MTPEQLSLLDYTLTHFKEIARQNRFPENNVIEHDTSRCVICHPELLPLEPLEIYLGVVAESVKVRRPSLDQDLVDAINNDLDLLGLDPDVSIESLLANDAQTVSKWRDWLLDALSTGLALLSIHSSTSLEFDLEDVEEEKIKSLIDEKIQDILGYQRNNR
jgi:hypothetical protein